MAASSGDGDSSDSSTDDATQQREQAAAAGQGGGTTRAHILRTRPRCSLLRRRGRPLSSLLSSISWLIRISWPGIVAWACFMKGRHDSASPWAEATGGASRRTMGTWHGAALGRVFGVKDRAQAFRVSDGVLGTTRGPHVRLALRLQGARCAQASVAHWAGAAVRHGVGKTSSG